MANDDYKPTNHTPGELAFLGGIFAYPLQNGEVESISDWKILEKYEDKVTGLEIYAVMKPGVHEVTFVIRGSDGFPDLSADWGVNGANASFSGTYHPQLRQAIEFIYDFKKTSRDFLQSFQKEDYTYSLAAHSKGAGFAQILAHIFGFDGIALDSAPASKILDNPEFIQHLKELDLVSKGAPKGFVNIIEKGSLVGDMLENGDVCLGLVTPKIKAALDILSSFTELNYEIKNGYFYTGAGEHIGTTVRVDLAEGSCLDEKIAEIFDGVKEQHSTFDDVLALSKFGIIGTKDLEIRRIDGQIIVLQNELVELKNQIDDAVVAYDDTEGILNGIEVKFLIENIENQIQDLEEHRDVVALECDKAFKEVFSDYGDIIDPVIKQALIAADVDINALEYLRDHQERDAYQIKSQLLEVENGLIDLRAQLETELQALEYLKQEDPLAYYYHKSNGVPDEINQVIDEWEKQKEELQGNLDNAYLRLNQIQEYLPEDFKDLLGDNDADGSYFAGFSQEQQEADNPSDIQVEDNQWPEPDFVNTPVIINIENDSDVYFLYSNGKIVKSSAIASNNGDGYSEIINENNFPKTKDELFDQLLELGVSEEDAHSLLSSSGFPENISNNLQDDQDNNTHDTDSLKERIHQMKVEAGEVIRANEITMLQAKSNLFNAIESGDGLAIIKGCIDYYSSLVEKLIISSESAGESWVFSEENQSIINSVSSLFDFGQAIEDGDGFSMAAQGINLLQDIDKYLEATESEFGDIVGYRGEVLLSLGSAGINLAHAIENGDELAAAQSSINLLREIDQYLSSLHGSGAAGASGPGTGTGFDTATALKGLGSAIGLAINIVQLEDALDSGDAGAIAYTVASTVNNAINTYNAAVNMLGMANIACSYSSYGGYAIAAIMAIEGDYQSAGEQLVLTVASRCLNIIPFWGQIAYIALQVASATRDMDGQILDKQSVEDAMDDVVSGSSVLAKIAFAEREIPAEIAERGHNVLAKINGFNLDFYDKHGIEIPEEMRDEFAFNQIMFENSDPMHVAQYLSDLDELSLSDLWASTNITPAVSAWIDEFENTPDFVLSTFTKTPQLVYEIVKKAISPKDVLSMVSSVLSDDDPPESTATFYSNDDGKLEMRISGDASMYAEAKALAEPVLGLMEKFRGNGGRLFVDGSVPSVRVISGEAPQIVYGGNDSGKIVVELDSAADLLVQMQGVMYARDRGERLGSAVALSTNALKEIDFSKIDAIMAGYGFAKKGITYTFGETTSRVGSSVGSGFVHGGGNVGPEGQFFTATPADFKSLPIPIEQLPSQKMGQINKIISANSLFSGNGAELMAMALILPGGLSGVDVVSAEDFASVGEHYSRPSGPYDFSLVTGNPGPSAQLFEGVSPESWQMPIPENLNYEQRFFCNSNGSTPLDPYWWPGSAFNDAAYCFRGSGQNSILEFARHNTSWYMSDQPDILLEQLALFEQEGHEFLEESSESFSGYRVTPDALTIQDQNDGDGAGITPVLPDGPIFVMAEDSILRFIPSELLEDTTLGGYSGGQEKYQFVSFGQAENGSVWIDDRGDIRFEPLAGFVGTGSFTYEVSNSSGTVEQRTATIIVQNVNDQPLLQDDRYILQEGEILYLDNLLSNDSDPDGDRLFIDHFRGLDHGEIVMHNGRPAFIPEEGYYGDVSFSYWVRDHLDAYPVRANVTITYGDVNNGVSANDDRFIIQENEVLVTNTDTLLANDVEYDGEALFFSGIAGVEHGVVSVLADGSVCFTPEQNYYGHDAGFSYLVQDESGIITSGYVRVEVVNIRNIPTVFSGTYGDVQEDQIVTFTPAEVATFVSDADGDSLHLSFVSNSIGGSFIIQDGCYTFVPETNYSGPASFDYTVSDNHGGTADGHLEFNITPVNDAIDTGDDQLTLVEDHPVVISVGEILGNDMDVDGNEIVFVGLGAARNGTVVHEDDGTITFTPEPDYVGDQAGFEYIVRDDSGLESTGWVKLVVTGENDPPEIVNTTLSLSEDQPITFDPLVLAQLIHDVDGDQLSALVVDNAVGGIVKESNGLYTFIPDADYNGPGSVHITATDGNGETVSAFINLDIMAVDDPAECGIDQFVSLEDEAVLTTVANIMGNDTDADGELQFAGFGQSRHGSVSVNDYGEITFIPDADYAGDEAGFTYLVKDTEGNESEGTVSIRVENINDAPEIIAQSLGGFEDQHIVFDDATISRFIRDLDGDTVALTSITGVTGGSVLSNGSLYTFIPDSDFHGTASLAYQATDGNGEYLSGVLSLDLLSINDPTQFGDDRFTILEEQPLLTSIEELLANDSDPDGSGTLVFTGLSGARHGSVNLAADGTITFIPDENYFGEEGGFAYSVCDDEGVESTGWVSVTVDNINDVPIITANRLFIKEDDTIAFTREEVARFLSDADGDLLQLDMVTNVEGGRVELNNGLYTFIPDQDYYGEAAFDYRAVNSNGEEITSHLSICILPENDLPTASSVAVSGVEDQEVTLQVNHLMAGAADVEDGAQLKFASIDSSLHGDVYVDSDGLVHFLPDDNFFGTGSFVYNILDSEGGVGKGYVEVAIAGVNDAPQAMDDDHILAWSNNQYENVFPAALFLANDFDVDFDPLEIVYVGNAEYGMISMDSDGAIHYTAPSDNWVGIDTFTYRISDNNGGFSEAKAEIDVKINTSPDVCSEVVFTSEDIISLLSQNELLANDSDIDGDNLRIIAVDQADHCSVSLDADGNIIFVPDLNYNNNYPSQARFRYTVSDGISTPVTAIALFDIDPVNDKPVLTPEHISGAVEDNSFIFNVADLTANDTDVEMSSPYEEDSISFAGVWGAAHGSLSYDPNSGAIYYVPQPDFCGTEQFSYAMIDSYGAVSIIESQIAVQAVNDLPVVEDDIGSAAEEYIWNYYAISDLVANDYDVDGDTLTITNPHIINGNGEVMISGGNLAVKPAIGADHLIIGYTVSDGHGGDVESRLTIPQVLEHNFAPQFTNLYRITYRSGAGGSTIFSFQVEDENGGNSWENMDDIATISAAHLRTNYPAAQLTQESGYNGHFKFWYVPLLDPDTDYYATFTLTATDKSGATGTIFVDFEKMEKTVGPIYSYQYNPVVLDLDGDGVELLSLQEGTLFDWNGDLIPDATGWVAPDDGLLAYDYDNDGIITKSDELSLKDYSPEAETDLEGLRSFDTNEDGYFDGADSQWHNFGVWQDRNSDGITDDGEFTKLADLKITAIKLQSDQVYEEQEGNYVYGTTSYQLEDGSYKDAADTGLTGAELSSPESGCELEIFEYTEVAEEGAEEEAEQSLPEEDVADEESVPEERIENGGNVEEQPDLDRIYEQLVSDLAIIEDNSESSAPLLYSDPALCPVYGDDLADPAEEFPIMG